MTTKYYNRQKNRIEIEKVYGEKFINFLYETKGGRRMEALLAGQLGKYLSMAYGLIQSSPLSYPKIGPFVACYDIDLSEYLPAEGREGRLSAPYSNFNEFFIRRFRPGARDFISDPQRMPAFAEGRYFGFERVTDESKYPVKGCYLSARDILGERAFKIGEFYQGPMLIARLCPVDYHRFHFPDSGRVKDFYPLGGRLHSVNPLALRHRSDIFLQNERNITVLETKNFGLLAYVEVGAICVGKIVQNFSRDFKRGEEKGYFLFGGSTVILLGSADANWLPSKDVLENTKKGIETLINLGDEVALITE